MLLLSSESSCDVCLERYGGYTVPNIIVCGHSFCQRCLLSLNPMTCPLCRAPFAHHDIRRLHADRASTSATSSGATEVMDESPQAREYLRAIMHVINSGGTTDGVTEFLQEVRNWLNTQPPDAHPVLRAAHVLFWKLWNKKSELSHAEKLRDALKERLLAESELAEAKYQELKQASEVEIETIKAVEQSLRDRLESTEREWEEKYDACLARCQALSEELESLKEHKGHPDTPPRTPEADWPAHADTARSTFGPLRVVDEEAVDDGLNAKEFSLSPVPRTRSIPTLPSASFRGISYESDRDDEGSKFSFHKTNPPHAVRPSPSPFRMRSSSSLLSRPEHDGASRSLPKSVSVPSPSPSPTASERSADQRSVPCTVNDGLLGLRIGESSAVAEAGDADQELQERWRSQLREVLDDPQSSHPRIARRKTVSGIDSARRVPHSSSSSATRNSSPLSSSPPGSSQNSVSTSPSIATPLVPPPHGPPRPQLISRASEAAMQAERARASAANSASTSPATTMHPMPREREAAYAYAQPHPPMRQTTPRRMSVESPKVKSPTATATASNLTRSLWAMQDSHRPEPQRVS